MEPSPGSVVVVVGATVVDVVVVVVASTSVVVAGVEVSEAVLHAETSSAAPTRWGSQRVIIENLSDTPPQPMSTEETLPRLCLGGMRDYE